MFISHFSVFTLEKIFESNVHFCALHNLLCQKSLSTYFNLLLLTLKVENLPMCGQPEAVGFLPHHS